MKEQGDLFEARTIRPIARGTDAATSHEAQEHLVRSGKHGSQLSSTLQSVADFPNLTAMELMRAIGHDRHKRLSDLLELGCVAKVGVRTCAVTDRSAAIWTITPEGAQALASGLPIVKVKRARPLGEE